MHDYNAFPSQINQSSFVGYVCGVSLMGSRVALMF